MKLIMFLIFVCSFNFAYAKDPVETTVDAFVQTEQGKKFKKNLTKQAKKYVKKVPPEMLALTQIGIEQEFNFNLNKNNSINFNYREESVIYQYQIDF